MDKDQIKRDAAAGMSAEQIKAKARNGGYQKQSGDEWLAGVLLFMLAILGLCVYAMMHGGV